jgi:hypothetical protein
MGHDNEELTRNIMFCIIAKDFKLPELPQEEEQAFGSYLLDWPPSLAEDEQAKSQYEGTTIIHTAEESNAKEMVDKVIESANYENHLVQLMSHLDWHVIEILMF